MLWRLHARRTSGSRLLACLLALLASGCATRVTAIRYEGVDTVALLPRLTSFDGPIEEGFDGVLVRVSSGEDLRAINGLSFLYGFASLCRDGRFDMQARLYSGQLFSAARSIQEHMPESGSALYWVAVHRRTRATVPMPDVTPSPRRSLVHLYVDHDLQEGIGDLCVWLVGNTGMFMGLRSNTVVVPAADIRRALSPP